jgi:hypothetical protein
MAKRKGKEFEQLVARLEEAIMDTPLSIKTNDKVEDLVTGQKREIDISIRGTLGSHPVFIIMECRDRPKDQDITWIEQLATKREQVGADIAVAVSSKGFFKPAYKLARIKNIELRTLTEIDHDTIVGWFEPTSIPVHHHTHRIINLNIFISGTAEIEPDLIKQAESIFYQNPVDGTFIFQEGLPGPISMNELISRITDFHTFFDDLKPGQKKIVRDLALQPDTGTEYQLVFDFGAIPVNKIIVSLELGFEIEDLPIISMKEYKENDRILGHTFRTGTGPILGPDQAFELYLPLKEEGRQVCLRIIEPNQE